MFTEVVGGGVFVGPVGESEGRKKKKKGGAEKKGANKNRT